MAAKTAPYFEVMIGIHILYILRTPNGKALNNFEICSLKQSPREAEAPATTQWALSPIRPVTCEGSNVLGPISVGPAINYALFT